MSKKINWQKVRKILIVRLRSIGDTVLSTPSILALRRHLPDAQIDILLEDWVAPVLDGFEAVDNVISVSKDTKERIKIAQKLRKENYDVAFNLHGGTTATLLIRASGAKHRVGYKNYQYSFLYNHLLSSASDFWQQKKTHSAEQQLALLGFVGIPVEDKPKTQLTVTKEKEAKIETLLNENDVEKKNKIALIHPAAAFESKQWATENFVEIINYLDSRSFFPIVVTAPNEKDIINEISEKTSTFFHGFSDLSLPEVTALARRADIFIGNDSGIAHIAAAVQTPTVVIFGSSNREHWRPWTDAPHEIVYEEFPCQPCAGYVCKEFGKPKCILSVKTESVIEKIERVIT